MDGAFPVLDASNWELAGTEAAGLTSHVWVRDPDPKQDRLWLFKPVVLKNGNRQGEDWVEKVAYEVASLLGLPSARVELSTRVGQAGCLSLDLRPSHWEMQPGAVLISELVRDYEPRAKDRRGHTLENIKRALEGVAPPWEMSSAIPQDAFDCFAGYLMLDALLANRDRHDENWSVLRPPPGDDGPDRLSGSYDHASALGFSLTTDARERVLVEARMEAWAGKGTAVKFERSAGAPVQTLVDVAAQALATASGGARQHWLDSLSDLSDPAIETVLRRVPGLESVTREFCLRLIGLNRERLLSG